MSGNSLTRADYCPNCGHTYIARYDSQRGVYRIGCPPERCDVVVEQMSELALSCVDIRARLRYITRLLRLGVSAEQLAHLSGDDNEAREDVGYPTV